MWHSRPWLSKLISSKLYTFFTFVMRIFSQWSWNFYNENFGYYSRLYLDMRIPILKLIFLTLKLGFSDWLRNLSISGTGASTFKTSRKIPISYKSFIMKNTFNFYIERIALPSPSFKPLHLWFYVAAIQYAFCYRYAIIYLHKLH